MSDARLAVQAARDIGADRRAASDLQKAELLLDAATQALDAGNYEAARSKAIAAKNEAVRARHRSLMIDSSL